MKKRIIWLIVSGLMALSLVLAACAPKVTEEKKAITEEKKAITEEKKAITEEKEAVVREGVSMVRDVMGQLVPKPQYGGVLNLVQGADPARGYSALDTMGQNSGPSGWHINSTLERLTSKDRTKGPAGTGEWTGLVGVHPPLEQTIGWLAESWEFIEPDTMKFKIRKGVRWQNKEPTWGAELTAEDVVYTLRQMYGIPGSIWPGSFSDLGNMKNPAESVYIDPDDPGTAVFRTVPGRIGGLWDAVAQLAPIYPKVLGAEGFGTWKGVAGTGPMILTDVVMGSSYTYERNPDYWAKDQLHPDNQLPYLDGVKIFVIPDMSTRFAALRTGKIDTIGGREINLESWKDLMRTNPELQWAESYADGINVLHMRHDTTPFGDVRVRRAMHMAINYDEIVNDYYEGKAEKFWWPAFPVVEHKLAYVPLEQMPKEVQELYSYNPDKAKKLLAEAGYPRGFDTSIIVNSSQEQDIDLLAIVNSYWAKVGVNLKIDVKEPAVYNAMSRAFSYKDGIMSAIAVPELTLVWWSKAGSTGNKAMVDEPLIEETYGRLRRNIFNWSELTRIAREVTPAFQMLAPHIKLPLPTQYFLWQPWLKSFHGEDHPEYYSRGGAYSRYIWIDQDLKQKMTGRR